jgi:thiamine transport system substrate-binding protein
MSHPRPGRRPLLLAAALLALTGCSLTEGGSGSGEPATSGSEPGGPVVLVTHESFALPKRLIRAFESDTGYTLQVRASGDAGTLTNKLVLTQGSPTGDVAFGVDNTFATRALDADVFQAADVTLPAGAEGYGLPEGSDRLVPIDSGSVCVNVDTTWFRAHDLAPPASLDDLTKPAYRDLFVTPGAPTSSPGMAFLLTTVAAYGDAWPDYWTDLMANGTRITSGWSDAYFVDFTQGGGDGTRPIVLSYDSSPAFTLKNGRSTTAALLDTCFQQVEYAGVLTGAKNPAGARALIEFLLSPEVQAALPESMYVFPVRDDVELPKDWARFAKRPSSPYFLDPAEIDTHRDEWLTTWQDVTSR